jgi:hypothetical protein
LYFFICQSHTKSNFYFLFITQQTTSRNITVFSSNLASLTIHHEHKKGSTGPDLLLSFHDNDHYNSVRLSSRSKLPDVKGYSHARPSSADCTSDDTTSSNESVRGIAAIASQRTASMSLTLSQLQVTDTKKIPHKKKHKQIRKEKQQVLEDEMSATEIESLSGSTTGTASTDVTALTAAIGYSMDICNGRSSRSSEVGERNRYSSSNVANKRSSLITNIDTNNKFSVGGGPIDDKDHIDGELQVRLKRLGKDIVD